MTYYGDPECLKSSGMFVLAIYSPFEALLTGKVGDGGMYLRFNPFEFSKHLGDLDMSIDLLNWPFGSHERMDMKILVRIAVEWALKRLSGGC